MENSDYQSFNIKDINKLKELFQPDNPNIGILKKMLIEDLCRVYSNEYLLDRKINIDLPSDKYTEVEWVIRAMIGYFNFLKTFINNNFSFQEFFLLAFENLKKIFTDPDFDNLWDIWFREIIKNEGKARIYLRHKTIDIYSPNLIVYEN